MHPWAAAGAALVTLALAAAPARAATTSIAIADLGFSDSSGEAADQTAPHRARLQDFAAALRRDIGTQGDLHVLALTCGQSTCAVDAPGVAALRERAREEGAALVLVAGVHKMSTLVLSLRVGVLDVATGRLVAERWLTFRGDTDEGWRRAGDYVAREIVAAIEPAK
ncbi:DUF2380 domain-containing protein [Ancylobacter lacus]|nr:DUF2380 domain-containing protein [Ancylobacter lacus]